MCCRDDGGCKHVVALLFSLVEWSERHMDRNTATCTDVHCVWDRLRRESKPKRKIRHWRDACLLYTSPSPRD